MKDCRPVVNDTRRAFLGCAEDLRTSLTGGAGESRTPDTQFRKLLLYPSELQPHAVQVIVARRLVPYQLTGPSAAVA